MTRARNWQPRTWAVLQAMEWPDGTDVFLEHFGGAGSLYVARDYGENGRRHYAKSWAYLDVTRIPEPAEILAPLLTHLDREAKDPRYTELARENAARFAADLRAVPSLALPICRRCKRQAHGWPLARPDVCAPADWRHCIRNPETVAAENTRRAAA